MKKIKRQSAKRLSSEIKKSINSGSIKVPRFKSDSEFMEWLSK